MVPGPPFQEKEDWQVPTFEVDLMTGEVVTHYADGEMTSAYPKEMTKMTTGLKFLDQISGAIRQLRFADPYDVATVQGANLVEQGRKVRFSFTLVDGHIVDMKAADAGPSTPEVDPSKSDEPYKFAQRKTWVRGVLSSSEDMVLQKAREEGWTVESRDDKHIHFIKMVKVDPSDGKIHVRRTGVPIDASLCGKTAQAIVSAAVGWWGPEGRGWADVCRECHRIEHHLKEPLP